MRIRARPNASLVARNSAATSSSSGILTWRVVVVGWMFAFGTFTANTILNYWTAADLPLWIAALVISRRSRPPWWLIALTLSVAIAVPWTASVQATAFTAARVYSLGVVGLWLVRNWNAAAFASGVIFTLLAQTVYLVPNLLSGRAWGISGTESVLGAVGYMLATVTPARPRWLMAGGIASAALTLGAAAARAPIAALAVRFAMTRPWRLLPLLVILLVTLVLIGIVRGSSLSAGTMIADARTRLDLATTSSGKSEHIPGCGLARDVYGPDYECGPGQLSILGDGAGAYLVANPWPRPHNIYTLAIHELGVFSIVPLAVTVWAIKARKVALGAMLGLAIYGVLDDTLLSHPAGHFVVAAVLIIGATRKDTPQSVTPTQGATEGL